MTSINSRCKDSFAEPLLYLAIMYMTLGIFIAYFLFYKMAIL